MKWFVSQMCTECFHFGSQKNTLSMAQFAKETISLEALDGAFTVEELERYRFGKGLLGKEPLTRGYADSWALMFRIVVMRQFRTYWRNIAYRFQSSLYITKTQHFISPETKKWMKNA
jgi:hypothetical protein